METAPAKQVQKRGAAQTRMVHGIGILNTRN